jgi:HSP20 family molecular chaperone IbpA
MEGRTRRRVVVLALIFGGVLLAAVVGQGAMILQMGKDLRALRGARSAPEPEVAPAGKQPVPAPADPGTRMQRLFDRALADPFADPFGDPFAAFGAPPSPRGSGAASRLSVPELELSERGADYVVRVGVPGEDAGKVNVQVDGQTLTINGTYSSKSGGADPGGGGAVAVDESRSFSQTLELPGPVDAGKMQAERDGGVLTIVLPKLAKS